MSQRFRRVVAGLLLIAAAGSAVVTLAYQREISALRTLTQGRSTVVDSPWGALEYAEAGDGPAVLMIHGSGGGFDQGLNFAGRINDGSHRLIVPSRFGYLRSDMPEGASPEMQADALAWLLGRLEIDRAVIIGGSAGALSATQLALRHPQLCDSLVLLVPALAAPGRAPDTNPAPNDAVQKLIASFLRSDFLFWLSVRAAPDQMTRLLFATDPVLFETASPAERQRVRRALLRVLPVSERQAGLMMDGATAGDPPDYAFEEISCPVLAISTRDDLYGTAAAAEEAALRAPDARLLMFETGGHLWVGHDEEIWRTIAAFIGETAGGGQ